MVDGLVDQHKVVLVGKKQLDAVTITSLLCGSSDQNTKTRKNC
ncbi:hypothetical protein CoNPh2_CDS0070 [Staphylococcus phage S-CoN_Ph2]|nr:hypothetical protein CoNPh1_CDS0089 [Staphylococcus phage S-CoN_Ph1]WNM51624.1 hypothetical protein CoNPh2_CDS0070 [Staphylococcus phage S-CoN_Ph2]WNM51969.1 hypothetical protein CoNPh4_CDS0093 [Staphylococcus phage S-CoN_Ph4]WNM52152.1 hypothetical protein CoNPh5_CDS0106 [Staphylococcus phage S-CoN_Ph5]WNM52457.1 hypothetical protein CoNPh7_CDS0085 [Staphylococcus phage S-CoN_Ph7]WNM52821.1 hypothetical protein CoNPh9_CDS0092 [Staphylococcus phage S-CoN_Ph9]WNM53361.1 hypothetical protein